MRLPLRILLALTSAALFILCFPPFDFWPLLFLSLPLLIISVTDTSPARSFYLGMLHGLITYGFSLSWLHQIFGNFSFSLFTMLASFTALFGLLANAVSKSGYRTPLTVLLIATAWMGVEFFRAELFILRFPWLTPGSALGPIWLSPIIGVYGVSFLIALSCAGIIRRKAIPFSCVLTVGMLALGILRPPKITLGETEGITVSIVQSEASFLAAYVELTKPLKDQAPELVVWPEYALPYDVRQRSSAWNTLQNHCRDLGAVFVIGTKTNVLDNGWRNTALVIGKDGDVLGEYYKARPVHFFDDGIPGNQYNPIKTEHGLAGAPICFDCDYTEITRKLAANGAEFFAVPSFDAEHWSARQHLQHAALFRLRAAETGKWMACAASSGVSQIIDPHGHVHAQIPPMEVATITGRISTNQSITFFVKAGWVLPWVALATTCTLTLIYLTGWFKGRRKRNGHTRPTASI